MKCTETSFVVDVLEPEADRTSESPGGHDYNGSMTVAEAKLSSGTVLRFVDEGRPAAGSHDQGRIGVIEITNPGTDPILPLMLREYGPSPLELFLAAAGSESAPPEKLVEDHYRVVKYRPGLSAKPRTLSLAVPLTGTKAYLPTHFVADVAPQHGLEVDYCLGLPGDYHFDFRSMETDVFGVQLSHHGHGQDLDHTHYGVTGLSSRRALGLCNAAGYVKSVRIQYEWISGVWIEVPIAAPGPDWIFPNTSLFYYSDSWPAVFRYRIKVGFTVEGLAGNTVHTEGSW